VLLSVFFLAWAVAAFIYYWRYPYNLTYPNFYAEDGQHFVQNIMDKGFLAAAFTTFNGYFITGIYTLTGIGMLGNGLFGGGEFVNLPTALALTSYAFLGLCCALPVLLLRPYLTLPYRLAMTLLLALVPLVTADFTTIGTIGNLKFAFAYIAVLLVMYRISLPRTSYKVFIVDALLALCMYTTAGAYFVLPFVLFGDGLQPKQLLNRQLWRKTFGLGNLALWSFVGLCAVACIQVAMILLNGVPENTGYLDEPYQANRTVELFFARSYLYPFISWGYTHLNDIVVVALSVASVAAMWRYGLRRHRQVYIIGVAALFLITAIFIANRTGVSAHYHGYVATNLDNFFYAQNFIAVVLGILLLSDLAKQFRWVRTLYLPLAAVFVLALGSVQTNRSYAPNYFMHYEIGTLQAQLLDACTNTKAKEITFSIYPFSTIQMSEPRAEACTPGVFQQNKGPQDFDLRPADGSVLQVSPGSPAFDQTFTANQNNLSGFAVYLATYYQATLKGYELTLKDKGCKQTLRTVPMPGKVRDNTFQTIYFEPIAESKGKTFCFTIRPTNQQAQQLALPLSAEYVYTRGNLSVLDTELSRDIVFEVLYKQ
jgi:hypothetical protein